ncbi:MAG: hypothetical protein H7645_01265 [Candidatus Heimdallarchaeota archaeon]|nr:hypothetical protein [Candidatus Heimdallarchaeota archaeon]MCK4768945.1 hypothetical protein [Candidatus Heimdallarchaeota archaeon]
MKKRSKSIDYETLFDFENLEDIRFHIAAREVENIGYMNIDEIKDYLKNIFNISLNKMKDWEDFRENYFRRNVIVHNNSRISEIYVRNLKLPNERIGEILYSDLEYAEKCIINTLSCIYFIKNQIEEKLKLE